MSAGAYYCQDCMEVGVETEMVDDRGAGHLCPVHDAHAPANCPDQACSGEEGDPCPLAGRARKPLFAGPPPDAVKAVELELAKHGYDSMSQDSGMHCHCGSDSRFDQGKADLGGGEWEVTDPKWRTIDEHRAQVVVWLLVKMVREAMA